MLRYKHMILWSLIFAFLFLALGQQQFISEDMLIHIPFIKKLQTPSVYQNDYFFQYPNPQFQSTIYYQLLSKFINSSNITLKLEILYFIFAFFLCWGLLTVIHKIDLNNYTGIIFLSFLALRFQVGGSAIQIFETLPLPRFFSLTIVIWSLFFLLDRRYLLSTFFTLIALFIHPLTVFYYMLCIAGFCVYSSSNKIKIMSLVFLGLLILGFAKYITPIDYSWLQTVLIRNSYAFIERWSGKSWLNLFILLLPGIVIKYWYKTDFILHKLLFTTFITAGLVSLIHLVLVRMNPSNFLISLQLGRIWLFPVWLSILSVTAFLGMIIKKNIGRVIFFGIILLLVMIRGYQLNQLYSNKTSWTKIQAWANSETDPKCVFLVPFYSKGFRVLSERSIVGEYKDGALSFYSEDFARDWQRRFLKLSNWESLSTAEIIVLQEEFKFDYFLESKFVIRRLPIVYVNNDFVVYDVRPSGICL